MLDTAAAAATTANAVIGANDFPSPNSMLPRSKSMLPRSISSGSMRGLFTLKRRTGSLRQDSVSLDLGCCSHDDETKSSPKDAQHPDEDDTIIIQLEGGLFGMTQPLKPVSRSGSFFLPRVGREKVDRTVSNESMDADAFLWNSDGDDNNSK